NRHRAGAQTTRISGNSPAVSPATVTYRPHRCKPNEHPERPESAMIKRSITASFMFLAAQTAIALADAPPIPESISTPNVVDTNIGKFEFKDGVPTKDTDTAQRLYDNLDFTYAFRAFMDNMRGVSIHALRKSMEDLGVKENEVLVFSELMDAKSLFLTANADTIYVVGYL